MLYATLSFIISISIPLSYNLSGQWKVVCWFFSDDILVILKFSNQNYFWWLLEEEKEYWIWSNYDQSSKLICHYEMTPLPWFPCGWWWVCVLRLQLASVATPPSPSPTSGQHRPVPRQPRSSHQQLVTMAVMEAASIILLLSLVSASAGGWSHGCSLI